MVTELTIDNAIAGASIGLLIGFTISTFTNSEEVGGAPNTVISLICAISGLIIAVVIS